MSTEDSQLARVIYTDGGASPNPGAGGWGVVSIEPSTGEITELSGGDEETTNNRMELTAAIRALESLPVGARVRLVTDSKYVKQGITEWVPRWVAAGWKRKVGKRTEPVLNEDLWRRLWQLSRNYRIDWRWTKGHAGDEHNERADALATAEIEARQRAAAKNNPNSQTPSTDVTIFLKITCVKGEGAWAAQITEGKGQELRTGRLSRTTANRVDLEATIELLEELPTKKSVTVHTGSDYLRRGASQWLANWKRSGWQTKSGGDVKNRDLWQQLDRVLRQRTVHWPEAPEAKETLEELHPITKQVLAGDR